MSDILNPAKSGINVILSIGNSVLCGQKNASLNRKTHTVNTTNQINNDWEQNEATTKSWSINCSGMIIKDATSFNLLENAFTNGVPLDIQLVSEKNIYKGKAIITSFPITANYSDTLSYNITLMGTGELKYE